jgi:hypothetical protein
MPALQLNLLKPGRALRHPLAEAHIGLGRDAPAVTKPITESPRGSFASFRLRALLTLCGILDCILYVYI